MNLDDLSEVLRDRETTMINCDHAWTNVLPSGYVTLARFCLKCGEVDAYQVTP